MVKESAPANDVGTATGQGDAALLHEIAVLRAALEKCASRIAELDRLAHIDPLVELPNRRNFLGRLQSSIANLRRNGIDGAVLFLDVDGLKVINDTFGHDNGDRALLEVSKLLVSSVRTGDVVARLSGDEFAILLERTGELDAWRMAERIVQRVEDFRFCVGRVCVDLSVAVGVAMIGPEDRPETVLSRADKEMYRIKMLFRH